MSAEYPFPIPERLPSKIQPCPIVEAVFEIRFATSESWLTLPGLVFTSIRERYKEQRNLPLLNLPEDVRRQEPALTYLPMVHFISEHFIVQLGPRVLSLTTPPNQYPGWEKVKTELEWLLKKILETGVLQQGERLSVRYIDFFERDVLQNLILDLKASGRSLAGNEIQLATVVRKESFTVRLQVASGAILMAKTEAKRGSVLDVDVWLGPLDFDLSQPILDKFEEAHLLVKQVFFGLLKPEFLLTLDPKYQ